MREAYYMAYDAAKRRYVKSDSKAIDERLAKAPSLVSAKFVIPYPPGISDQVPGQVVHERDHHVHWQARREGDPRLRREEGLELLKPDALTSTRAGRGTT